MDPEFLQSSEMCEVLDPPTISQFSEGASQEPSVDKHMVHKARAQHDVTFLTIEGQRFGRVREKKRRKRREVEDLGGRTEKGQKN